MQQRHTFLMKSVFLSTHVRIARLRFWLDFKIKAMQRGPFLKVLKGKRFGFTFYHHTGK